MSCLWAVESMSLRKYPDKVGQLCLSMVLASLNQTL